MVQGRRALVTGGTGSVGHAIVRALSAAGAAVVFQFFRQEEAAKRLAKETGAQGVAIDLREPFLLPEPTFDIVINNAGLNVSDAQTHLVRDDDWISTLQVNLTAPFRIARQCLPHMVERKWGRIVNVSSIYGMRAVEGNLPYTVSKHGLRALTATVAKEYGAHGITCNEVCPGPIESRMMDDIARREGDAEGITPAEYLAGVRASSPTGRMARPVDIAKAVLFLVSADAAQINGVSIPIDGGLIA